MKRGRALRSLGARRTQAQARPLLPRRLDRKVAIEPGLSPSTDLTGRCPLGTTTGLTGPSADSVRGRRRKAAGFGLNQTRQSEGRMVL